MINDKQLMQALTNGKVLIDGMGNRLSIVEGTLTLLTFKNTSEPFYKWIDCLRWQFQTPSKNWEENIEKEGLACWVWEDGLDRTNACIDIIMGKQSILKTRPKPLFYSKYGNFWPNAYPLTLKELNIYYMARQHYTNSKQLDETPFNNEVA